MDVESYVYSTVTKAAKAMFPTLTTASWTDVVEPKFPFALVQQTDDFDVRSTLNSTHSNEARHVTFEVNVYSDKARGRKAEAKSISSYIALVFKSLGFVETAGGSPIDLTDEQNRHLARYMCRFEASVQGGQIFNP